jgi:hypothetical protein
MDPDWGMVGGGDSEAEYHGRDGKAQYRNPSVSEPQWHLVIGLNRSCCAALPCYSEGLNIIQRSSTVSDSWIH